MFSATHVPDAPSTGGRKGGSRVAPALRGTHSAVLREERHRGLAFGQRRWQRQGSRPPWMKPRTSTWRVGSSIEMSSDGSTMLRGLGVLPCCLPRVRHPGFSNQWPVFSSAKRSMIADWIRKHLLQPVCKSFNDHAGPRPSSHCARLLTEMQIQ